MTYVYVVVNQGWGGVVVEGVFQTMEKSQKFIDDNFKGDDRFNCFTQVVEVK